MNVEGGDCHWKTFIDNYLTPIYFYLLTVEQSRNSGSLTPGVTDETVDGMSKAKIDAIIHDLRYERYRWMPARRVHIKKKNSSKKRPLGIPRWSDKLLQEVIRRRIGGILRTTV